MNGEATTPSAGFAPVEGDAAEDAPESPVMELLQEKVPLSLLMDLTAPAGPDSEAILDEEGEPEEAWWEQP
jgi:hypothetical protein